MLTLLSKSNQVTLSPGTSVEIGVKFAPTKLGDCVAELMLSSHEVPYTWSYNLRGVPVVSADSPVRKITVAARTAREEVIPVVLQGAECTAAEDGMTVALLVHSEQSVALEGCAHARLKSVSSVREGPPVLDLLVSRCPASARRAHRFSVSLTEAP